MAPLVLKRHGDLLIVKIGSPPLGLREVHSDVLAVGESTGHVHKLSKAVLVLENDNGDSLGELLKNHDFEVDLKNAVADRFFVADVQLELTHDEHKPLVIEEGTYAVIAEREYDPFAAARAEELVSKELKNQKAHERALRRSEFWRRIED